MQIDILYEDDRWRAAQLTGLAREVMDLTSAHLHLRDGFEISILACNDARIADLNAEFRGKPLPTNVLSWPSDDRAPLISGERPAPPVLGPMDDPSLGDVAISWETCVREAENQGKSFPDHVSHLLAHGMLHLLGYDHETDADARIMEDTEREILAKMGRSDPYGS